MSDKYCCGHAVGAGDGAGRGHCNTTGQASFLEKEGFGAGGPLYGAGYKGSGDGCGLGASFDAYNSQWEQSKIPTSSGIEPEIEARIPVKIVSSGQAVLVTIAASVEQL